MSDNTENLRKLVTEIWGAAIKSGGQIFEKAEYDFSVNIDAKMQNLNPSQFEEYLSLANEIGAYVPAEDRVHWMDDLTKEELGHLGFDE